MYEFLEGRVAERSAARLVLEVSGVAYDLAVPLGSSFSQAEPLRVWTHLVVREDAHLLFGFSERGTRDLFRLLLKVRGVGPNMALAVLSGMERDELLGAILEGDSGRLMRAKGVGKKTAEQILLDLADVAAKLSVSRGANDELVPYGTQKQGLEEHNIEDAVGALVSIGFSEKEARKNVERAAAEVDAANLEGLVKTALRR